MTKNTLIILFTLEMDYIHANQTTPDISAGKVKHTIDVMVMSDYQFLMNIAKTTGFAFLEVTCMKSTY